MSSLDVVREEDDGDSGDMDKLGSFELVVKWTSV